MTRARGLSPVLSITLDPARGVALLRGAPADRAAWLLTRDEAPPRWSARGRGWVVPYGVALDATGWAQAAHVPCRVTTADGAP